MPNFCSVVILNVNLARLSENLSLIGVPINEQDGKEMR
jgi:hypothetical protein